MVNLEAKYLRRLVRTVFPPLADEESLAILLDIPNTPESDTPAWRLRRALAYEWYRSLSDRPLEAGLKDVALIAYPSVDRNNADLPEHGFLLTEPPPDIALDLADRKQSFQQIFSEYQLFLAPTQYSTTAPLKNAAKIFGFRAATMPGFSPAMIPALRLNYAKIHARCALLKQKLDVAYTAHAEFKVNENLLEMTFDLRYRTAHLSSGRFLEAGTAGNLPSGETYIVPYEGEKGEASRTAGLLPVQFDDEIVIYRVENNRAVEVISSGEKSRSEAELLRREPAYGNIAELGFGVLDVFGIEPIGEILLDEKLGFHVAFGRSDHFGGVVGPSAFSSPSQAVHIDRIYVPKVQNRVQLVSVHLDLGSKWERIIDREGYTIF